MSEQGAVYISPCAVEHDEMDITTADTGESLGRVCRRCGNGMLDYRAFVRPDGQAVTIPIEPIAIGES